MSRHAPGSLLIALSAALFLFFAPGARAHVGFNAETNVSLRPDRMDVVIRMMPTDLLTLLGDDAPPVLDKQGFDEAVPLLKKRAGRLYEVASGGGALPPGAASVNVEDDGYLAIHVVYPRPTKWPLAFTATFTEDFGPEFTGRISVYDLTQPAKGKDADPISGRVQIGTDTRLEVPAPKSAIAATTPPPAAVTPLKEPPFQQFLRLGIEHILTGYDHLLFLMALLVGCRRVGPMLGIITSFTLAHSITLALAAFDLVRISSSVVEPIIAASIVVVGLENLFAGEETGARQPIRIFGRTFAFSWPRRWQLAFVFGLIHGFGFASALRDIGLGANGASVLVPLVSFNLGVECGQLAVAIIAMPIFLLARRIPGVGRYVVPAVSAVVVVAGGYWFLQRTIL